MSILKDFTALPLSDVERMTRLDAITLLGEYGDRDFIIRSAVRALKEERDGAAWNLWRGVVEEEVQRVNREATDLVMRTKYGTFDRHTYGYRRMVARLCALKVLRNLFTSYSYTGYLSCFQDELQEADRAMRALRSGLAANGFDASPLTDLEVITHIYTTEE